MKVLTLARFYRDTACRIDILNFTGVIMTLLENATSTSEADELVLVCVELLAGDLEIDITVFLSTNDGTAKSKGVHLQTYLHYHHYHFVLGNQDYMAVVREPLVFSSGSPVGQRECTNIR